MSVQFSTKAKNEFEDIIGRYPNRRAAMLPTLHLAVSEFGHISGEVEQYVAELLEVPVVKVREVVTFYTLYPRQKIGKYHFQVCRGLSCHLCGHVGVMDYLCNKLGIRAGETSGDLRFTITPVECLAACETGPMLQLNDDYIGDLTPEKIDELVKSLD